MIRNVCAQIYTLFQKRPVDVMPAGLFLRILITADYSSSLMNDN